ncbi:oxidoreductase [Lithospermum erythrorhizon]|uniref:Oxidoreductase n=1 Tax=Lithospermum erythrorhizon TaxID=34254 RepID=A0AAV3NV97_LITER
MGFVQIRELSEKSGSGLEERIKKIISDNPVVVYSKTYCPFSSEVKFLFKRLDVEAQVIELDQLGDEGLEMLKVLKRLTDQHSVPNVFIGGKHIGGCSETLKLYKEGELEDLLAEAEA